MDKSLNSRKPVKGTDYIGLGCGAMVFDCEGKVLLGKRGAGCRNEHGLWDFPGGGVDFNEKCEVAVRREVREEFGIRIKVLELLHVVDHILREEGQHWVCVTYVARYISGDVKILEPKKCEEFRWFDLNEIDPEILTITSRKNLKDYIDKFGYTAPK